jgi:hypothetical protein
MESCFYQDFQREQEECVCGENKGDYREMRRNFPSSILAAAILAAGSLAAAPNAGVPAAQYLSQINEQTFQIQTQADRLEAYLRSGAHDWTNSATYTFGIAEEAQKLSALLDQVAARPGANNDTRMQVQKMKTLTTEVLAFAGSALQALDTHAMALHKDNVFANTSNIEERCDMIRSAAQNLLIAH